VKFPGIRDMPESVTGKRCSAGGILAQVKESVEWHSWAVCSPPW